MSISISQPIYIKRNKNYQMKTMLTTIVIIVAVAAAATGATTVITTIEIFAQNKSSPMDQLINDCMYNNVTACNALEHYNSTTYPATGLNTTAS
jgi:hypothetical protein